MLVNRPPNRMMAEQERQERAEKDAKGPRPISTIGGGRGGSLISFTQGAGASR